MEIEPEAGPRIQTHIEGKEMIKVKGTIGVDQEADPDMNHPENQEEIPDQKVTTDQGQDLIQDQDPIDQDPIVIIDLITEIKKQSQKLTISVTSMEQKPEITQQ